MSRRPGHDRRRRAVLCAAPGALLCAVASVVGLAQEAVNVRANIELEGCEALLKKIARLFKSGFDRSEAEALFRAIDALPTEQAGSWRYEVVHDGVASTLAVRATIDELSMVDLDFETTPTVAPLIRRIVFDATDGRGT